MKKTLRILATAVAPVPIIAGLALAGTANASQQPLVAIPHNVNSAVTDSTRVGDLAAGTRVSVAVALKLHDEAGLHRLLGQLSDPRSPQYRHYLTPRQFTDRFGPTTADVAAVTSFLKANGLQVAKVSGNRQVVDATGTAAAMDRAFHTHLSQYRQQGHTFYANDTAPALPAAVANVVQGVVGLDNHAVRHTYNVKLPHGPASPQQTAGGFTPSQLQTSYDTGSLGSASGQSVALWEFDGYQASNIASYDSEFGINAPAPQTVSVDGSNYDGSPGQGQGEVELDIEIVQAITGGATTYVYEAPNSDQGQIDMANQIVSDDKVSVTSISWGQCETQSASATITSTSNAFAQGVAEGISFYSASGDSGSDDCQNSTTAVDYPASDPSVTGVGGTTLTADGSGNYQSETAWSGSGGGYSSVFKTPSWQNDASGNRAVPDVSSDADPNTGYAIYSAGSWQVYGGTSCAAPMWAGWTALYDQNKGSKLGNGNPAFYTVGNGSSYGSAFHDVTSGSNGSYNAGTGYDPVTGWGSYDGAGLSTAIG